MLESAPQNKESGNTFMDRLATLEKNRSDAVAKWEAAKRGVELANSLNDGIRAQEMQNAERMAQSEIAAIENEIQRLHSEAVDVALSESSPENNVVDINEKRKELEESHDFSDDREANRLDKRAA